MAVMVEMTAYHYDSTGDLLNVVVVGLNVILLVCDDKAELLVLDCLCDAAKLVSG